MLKKRERLTKKEFDRFFATGRRVHSPAVQLIYTPCSDGVFHGAVVVGKKVHKSAVDRNRLRRRIYAFLYAQKKQQGLTGIYILIAKPLARTAPITNVFSDILELIGKTQKAR